MRYLVAIVLFCTLVSLATGTSSAYDWYITTVDHECGANTSIAIDSQDHPNISYPGIRFAKWTGTEWDIQIVDPEGGTDTSIALDSQDYPHISYHFSHDYSYDLRYARWTGSEWLIQTVDSEGYVGSSTSIALDDQGHPHISYRDYGNGYLKYARWTGSEWNIQIVDSEDYIGSYTSIALDSQDYPHISYSSYNSDSYDYDLKYARWTGSEWEIQTLDSAYWGCYSPSIALDSQDYSHISYYKETNEHECYLCYAKWTGTTWEIQTIGDYVLEGGSTSIALDSQDYPHISHHVGPYYSALMYTHWTGSVWETYSVDSYGDVGYCTSIALDTSDNPHISYYELASRDLTRDIKYAYYGDPLDIDLISFSAHPEDSAISINWSVQTTEDEHILGFNLYRREMKMEDRVGGGGVRADGHPPLRENETDIWTKINTSLITGENPYTYTDSDVEAGVAYEYKLEAVLADDSPETLGTTQATAGLPPASFAILALYPNPASDMLTCLLAMPEVGIVDLTLYDLSGRLVLNQPLEATEPSELEAMFDVSALASGIYTLRASYDGAEVSPACGGVAVVVR